MIFLNSIGSRIKSTITLTSIDWETGKFKALGPQFNVNRYDFITLNVLYNEYLVV